MDLEVARGGRSDSEPRHVEVHGLRMPRVALGTWELRGERCRAVVETALALGYRGIDTAQAYGNEAEVGAALAASGLAREDVFLTTKAWPDDLVERDPLVVAGESLARLGVDEVDLLLLHWPSPRLPLAATLEALGRVQAAGLARFVGVSNFPAGMLREALAHAPIVCDQVEYHPFLPQERLLRAVEEEGLLLTAHCPLARGRVASDPTLRAIGRRHGKSASQVALRWLLDQPRVTVVPKASSEAHLREDLDVFDFALEPADRAAIAEMSRRVPPGGGRAIDPDFAPDWDA